ncbi:MAG: hypothetical protein VX278_02480 [Myxococcota bacterium]|nr:hypothetical protein [Myxococcota bacterium]
MKRTIPMLSAGLLSCTTSKGVDTALDTALESDETPAKTMVGVWEAEQFMGQDMPYTYTSDANNFSIMVDRLSFDFSEDYGGSFYMRRVVYTDDGSEEGYSSGTVLLSALSQEAYTIAVTMAATEEWLEDFFLDCQLQEEKLYCYDSVEEVDMLLVHAE